MAPDVRDLALQIQQHWYDTRSRFHVWCVGRGMNGDEKTRLERRLWAAQPARTDGTDTGFTD